MSTETASQRFGRLPSVARAHCRAMWRGDIDRRHRHNRALLGRALKYAYGLTDKLPELNWYRYAVNDRG